MLKGESETLINRIEKNATKLLDVLLLETLVRCPMEALGEARGDSKRTTRDLQVGKQLLELVRDAVVLAAMHLRIVGIRKDMASDFRSHEKGLQKRVHVAGCALV